MTAAAPAATRPTAELQPYSASFTGAPAWAPWGMVFARWVLAYAAHALTALVLMARGVADPWLAAAHWWTVSGTLIDVGCLGALAALTRREGRTVFSLVGFDRARLGRDLALGLGWLLLLGLIGFASGSLTGFIVYGDPGHVPPIGGLPRWATLYSVLVWPVIWGFTEQVTYNGYALPRLIERFGRKGPALALVWLCWAGQHIALPALFDPRFMLYRFFSSLPIAVAATLLYLRTRRLVPLIVAHVFVDILAPLSVILASPR